MIKNLQELSQSIEVEYEPFLGTGQDTRGFIYAVMTKEPVWLGRRWS